MRDFLAGHENPVSWSAELEADLAKKAAMQEMLSASQSSESGQGMDVESINQMDQAIEVALEEKATFGKNQPTEDKKTATTVH